MADDKENITGADKPSADVNATSNAPLVEAEQVADQGKASSSGNSFFDQMLQVNKATPKREYNDVNTEAAGSDNPEENSEGNQDEQAGSKSTWSNDQINAEARAHVELFDFAASRGLALYAVEKPELYTSTPAEKDRLTEVLAKWYETMDAPPKFPPWLMLIVVVLMIYGPKISQARKTKKSKKKAAADAAKKEQTAERPPIKFEINKNADTEKTAAAPVADDGKGT